MGPRDDLWVGFKNAGLGEGPGSVVFEGRVSRARLGWCLSGRAWTALRAQTPSARGFLGFIQS